MNKLFMITVFLFALNQSASACTDFSGTFLSTYTKLEIAQVGCELVSIEWFNTDGSKLNYNQRFLSAFPYHSDVFRDDGTLYEENVFSFEDDKLTFKRIAHYTAINAPNEYYSFLHTFEMIDGSLIMKRTYFDDFKIEPFKRVSP